MQLDRNRLFALIGALEEDLRFIIEAHLLATHHETQILGHAYDKAADRLARDEDRELAQTSLVDYLDLGDEIEILNRWRDDLPSMTRESLVEQSAHLGKLVSIRNRVVHRRPLLVDDFDTAQRILVQLDSQGFEGSTLRETLDRLREDATWAPSEPTLSFRKGTLNNLPLGDFDDTGLIGRRREQQTLGKMLMNLSSSRRGPVLTVIGPGGVGKTALVLQALHDLVNHQDCPYDIVSWISLKTERLTAQGIQSIHDAVLSVEQAVPALVEALDPTFKGTASQLADSLDGLAALIVIDNLETVSGREVLDLMDTLPETVSYLITSREGLGEIERRIPLDPLEEHYAVDLFRKLARARGLEAYARMKQGLAEDIVRQLGASPLGLKWFVSSIAIGKDPQDLLQHREELVRYCVENVFNSLDEDSKMAASVLHVLSRPATLQEVRLFLPDMHPDAIRAAMQALLRRTLVRHDLLTDSISETYEATEPLSDYLRYANVVDAEATNRVREMDDDNRRQEERHRLDAATDPLRPNIVQGTRSHRASVLLLRDALSRSKGGHVEHALDRIRQAEHLDPEFWELHRVRGFILSSNSQVEQATAAYLRAIELAPDNNAAAIVKYYFAGHLSRRERNPERAVTVAGEAHNVLQSPKTAIELGRALTYIGEFHDAETVLMQAIESDDVRTRLIAITQLVDCMRRRAEGEGTVDRQPDKAIATVGRALELADSALQQGLVDQRLTDKTIHLASDLLRLARDSRHELSMSRAVEDALEVVHRLGRDARRSREYGYLVGHARQLIRRWPSVAMELPLLAAYDVDSDDNGTQQRSLNDSTNDGLLLGSIKVWKADRHFGFIVPSDREEDCYFNLGYLSDASDEILLRAGVAVQFARSIEPDRKTPLARDVRIDEFDADALHERRLVVERLHDSGNYLFAIDVESGATVFVNRYAMRNVSAWRDIRIGLTLQAAVEIEQDGRFRAAARSVRILH